MRPTAATGSPTTLPRLADAAVQRRDLLNRLDSLAPLTVLHGLSGAGKTTLAVSWAMSRKSVGDTVWWFNAADIPDPSVVLDTIRTAGQDTAPTRIVILDDAHYLSDSDVLSELIEELRRTPHLHLLICTRTSHELISLAKTAMLDTNVLLGAHLNVTAAQLPEFAESWGHEITARRAKQISGDLGSWLGLLRHTLDHAHPDRDPAGLRAATEYLRENVLPMIGDRNALLASMVLAATGHSDQSLLHTIFRPGTPAGQLLGTRSCTDLVTDVTQHGFLEPAPSGKSTAGRYPAALSAILARILDDEHPQLAHHVHQTTATWLAEQDTLEQEGLGGLAVVHARATEDWNLLARMWNDHGLCLTIHHPEQAYSAYSDIPDSIITDHPELALASSVISALGPDLHDPRRHRLIRNYREAGWAIHALPLPPGSPSILEATAKMISARHHGDVLGAHQLASAYAQQHLEPLGSHDSLLHRAWFKLQWAVTAFNVGNNSEAITLLTSAAHYARMVGASAIVSATSAQLALANAIDGYTRTAHEHLADHHAIHTENQWLHHPVRAAGQIAQGILLLDRLDPAAAEHFTIPGADHLEEWAVIAWARTQHALLFADPILALTEVCRLAKLHQHRTRPESSNQRILDRCLADLYLALGELNRCHRHIQDAGSHHLSLAVPKARLAFTSGDYPTAMTIAASHAWDAATTLRDRIDLVMLKAAAALRMGDTDAARRLFARAHHLASDADTLMPYAVLPDPIRGDLLGLIEDPLDAEALTRIGHTKRPYPEQGDLVVLTPRETVVLYAMVEYETLADIADGLVVSLNTVKKQAHSVYAKLGVHDRQTVLLQAHRLGLLPKPSAALTDFPSPPHDAAQPEDPPTAFAPLA